MKTPPLAGSVVRVGVGLLLCAACFQAGRSYQELSASASAAAKDASGTEMVDSTFVGPHKPAPSPAETSPQAAPGDVPGESVDIITPLNVRDPSALVMGPTHNSCPPPEVAAPEGKLAEPPYKEPKPKKMKEGRLLELLKKEDKKSVYPKRY
ncbi:MAG: hypothetical protein HYV14_17965 [Elusimicrobia bacterium]|nr:hypothetical protein [Elusimicrobiota bacterium]